LDAVSRFCPGLLADRGADWRATSVIHSTLEANRTYLAQVRKLVDVQSTNTLTNAFLSRLLVRNIHKDTRKTSNKKSLRIFLTRRGEYESRIANHAEILAALDSIGFIALDASAYSVERLINIFANAEAIVSECGSTALNACLFSPQSVPIICLAPNRLVQEPDEGMIRGGLIYTLAFCERLEYYMGDSTQKSAVQSSDVVYYEAAGLIKRICASLA
jgi:capsular polysaccharide biosynthesis protein